MGRKGQAALGAGAHEEEFAELQRRFDALSSAKKLSETSPALLTKDMYRTEKKQQAVRRDDPQLHAQLKTLDEQIVQLRRRHDRLHDNNNKKRRELDLLADRLQDLHNSAFKSEDAPQVRLRAQEERLVAAAHRYEESHRTKLTYEQVIERLKTEQLSWPEEVKALDTTLVQKEQDYEQLLLMSHGAHPSLRWSPAPVTHLSHPAPARPLAPCADANSSKEAVRHDTPVRMAACVATRWAENVSSPSTVAACLCSRPRVRRPPTAAAGAATTSTRASDAFGSFVLTSGDAPMYSKGDFPVALNSGRAQGAGPLMPSAGVTWEVSISPATGR